MEQIFELWELELGWFQDNWDAISSILLRTVEIEMFLAPVDLWRYYLQLYL